MLPPKPKPSPLTAFPDKAGDAVGALCGGGCSCPKWAGTVDDNRGLAHSVFFPLITPDVWQKPAQPFTAIILQFN